MLGKKNAEEWFVHTKQKHNFVQCNLDAIYPIEGSLLNKYIHLYENLLPM